MKKYSLMSEIRRRRILCNLFGQLVEDGEYPADWKRLGQMVENISYNNTLRYFGFDRYLK